MRFFVRPMQLEDIPQAAGVERECFPTGWIATPFKRELRNRIAAYLVACEARDPQRAAAEAGVSSSGEELAGPPPKGLLARFGALLGRRPSRGAGISRHRQHVVGFLGVWFMVDEAHITAVGVRERYRRLGVGELLLLAGLEVAIPRGARVATLEVRTSNRAAQKLYEKYGFQSAGLRKGYYSDNREDALIMTTGPVNTPEYAARLETLRRDHAARWGASVRQVG